MLSCTVAGFAQTEKPRTEFTLSLDSNSLEIQPGATKEVTMQINRSKSYSKSKAAFGLSSTLPAGIAIVFNEMSGDAVKVQVTASSDVQPGKYLLILNSTMKNKKKGITLNLVVDEPVAPAASKE
jgi:acetyl/propionyl-CoA carboxylase alpha subunit